MDDEGFRILAANACSLEERPFLEVTQPELRAYYDALAQLPIPEPWLALIAAAANSSTTTAVSRSDEPNAGASTGR